MRHFIFDLHSGVFTNPLHSCCLKAWLLLWRNLDTDILREGRLEEDGGRLTTVGCWDPGLHRSFRVEGKQAPGSAASHCFPAQHSFAVCLAFDFLIRKMGQGSTCRAVVRLGWHRRRCHKLSRQHLW